MPAQPDAIVDSTPAYHLWDELYAYSLKLALAGADDSAAERERARARLLRAQEVYLKQRDAMLERLLARRTKAPARSAENPDGR
jgi:hypothetical protein